MDRVTLLSLAAFICPVALTAQQPTAPPAVRPSVPHDSVRGAIRVVDVRARTLRVVRLQVPAGVPITNQQRGQREPIRLGELKPGDVIRASFGGRPTGFVAYTIERLGRMNAGVDAKP